MPYIYGESAHYIDTYSYEVDIDKLLNEDLSGVDAVLEKFSWDNAEIRLYNLLIQN